MERLMKAHLTEFNISMRILIPLEGAGITRLGHLVNHTRASLRTIPQLGKVSVEKIEAFLSSLDLTLLPEEEKK